MSWLARFFGSGQPAAAPAKTMTASKPPVRQRIFRIVGEAATNANGTSRQDVLLDMEPGEGLSLSREPNNPEDRNAIRVDDFLGRCIGYIARQDAAILAPIIDGGNMPRAKVHRISGGVPHAPHYGCEVSLIWTGQKPHAHRPLYEEQIAFRKRLKRKL